MKEMAIGPITELVSNLGRVAGNAGRRWGEAQLVVATLRNNPKFLSPLLSAALHSRYRGLCDR